MRAEDFPEIRDLDLFREMSAEMFGALMRGAYLQTFPPRVQIVTEGDSADFLHVVVDGLIELFASWQENETTMAVVQPVSTFILAATIRDQPYLMSGRTIEKTRLIMIPSEDVRAIFEADAAFARAIVRELAARYRAMVKTAKDLKLRNSGERLANYLLARMDEQGGADEFSLRIEKRRLASLLGMTPENLSRAIRALADYGVHVRGPRVAVSDEPALRRLARPDPLIDDPAS